MGQAWSRTAHEQCFDCNQSTPAMFAAYARSSLWYAEGVVIVRTFLLVMSRLSEVVVCVVLELGVGRKLRGF